VDAVLDLTGVGDGEQVERDGRPVGVLQPHSIVVAVDDLSAEQVAPEARCAVHVRNVERPARDDEVFGDRPVRREDAQLVALRVGEDLPRESPGGRAPSRRSPVPTSAPPRTRAGPVASSSTPACGSR
jgi:hypothetical protein